MHLTRKKTLTLNEDRQMRLPAKKWEVMELHGNSCQIEVKARLLVRHGILSCDKVMHVLALPRTPEHQTLLGEQNVRRSR